MKCKQEREKWYLKEPIMETIFKKGVSDGALNQEMYDQKKERD